ncbi:MAG: protein-glutamate O-methyltransferase CheR [Immundisolibacteraceae bacterium]|nr:protein-glutamate O-methyltransferase CheR [Immundisolibacteraceae bacterium]
MTKLRTTTSTGKPSGIFPARKNPAVKSAERRKTLEFAFDASDFSYLQKLVKEKSGIVLADDKQVMAYSRLTSRLRALKIDRFRDYFALINRPGSDEIDHCLNAISTNLTSFFREKHHFDFLAKTILPIVQKRTTRQKNLRIWSAGCSSGEEAYSVAITICESLVSSSGWDIEIIATDLDSNMISNAKAGRYNKQQLTSSMDDVVIQRYFEEDGNYLKAKARLKNMISFSRLNLLGSWPAYSKFDLIICRNVIIYFDKPTKQKLIERYHQALSRDGHLFLGHSEKMDDPKKQFNNLGKTCYLKAG